jgi:hypothetical protein
MVFPKSSQFSPKKSGPSPNIIKQTQKHFPIPSHPHLHLQVIRAIRLLRGIAVLVIVLVTPHQRTAAHLEGQRRSLVTLAVHGGVGAGDQPEGTAAGRRPSLFREGMAKDETLRLG